MFLPHQLPAKCPCGGTFLARVGRYRKPPDTREEADALARLKLELAENIAALQRLHILVLRNCGHVTSSELFEVTRHLTRYHNLPEDVREAVNRIRKERWNIE
jgi:hypothetical protein